jgi:hypothetical protein
MFASGTVEAGQSCSHLSQSVPQSLHLFLMLGLGPFQCQLDLFISLGVGSFQVSLVAVDEPLDLNLQTLQHTNTCQ